MITDELTNKVYFSEYLKDYKCWKNIKEALHEHEISFEILPGTKDIWVRDFMPIQKDVKSFIGYEYNPDYLKEEQQYITRDVQKCFEFTPNSLMTMDIIVDGGNVIKCNDKVIMTDKVFVENKEKNREFLKTVLEESFGCEVVFIPWDKAEKYGHSDGMVRYVEPGHIVINNYADIDEQLREELLKVLRLHFSKISELQYGKYAQKNSWAHINFLRVGNFLLVPQIGIASDTMAIEQLKEIYRDCEVVPCEAKGIVAKGGAFNCVSWNIKE